MMHLELVDDLQPAEFVGTEQPGEPILVFTIHDGHQVPRRVLGPVGESYLASSEINRAFILERDWGANLFAEQLVAELGLSGYFRVNLARVLIDYGRLPGVSLEGVPYLLRKSIFPPTARLLSPAMHHTLIRRYYDGISECFTQSFAGRSLTLGIHTYDPRNANGTVRPEVSLVTRGMQFQADSTLPPGLFDPLFPSVLCESTVHKALTYRIVLDLEASGRYVALNHPYVMPEGSVEIRAQVWYFFRSLRGRFLEAFPETRGQAAFQRVWQMLLDTTQRSSECEQLRGYLHQQRDAPHGLETLFAEARHAYDEIARFLRHNEEELVWHYRASLARPSCLGIEVRKDLLFEVDWQNEHVVPRPDAQQVAREIAVLVAKSVRAFYAEHQPGPIPAFAPERSTRSLDEELTPVA